MAMKIFYKISKAYKVTGTQIMPQIHSRYKVAKEGIIVFTQQIIFPNTIFSYSLKITAWIPIFIACPGNKRSVYRSWLTPAPLDKSLEISLKTCEKDHKRRSIIDRWNWDADDLIDQVLYR